MTVGIVGLLKSEAIAWIEACLSALPGRVGRLMRRIYWQKRLRSAALPLSIGRNVEITGAENISFGSQTYIVDRAVLRAERGSLVCGNRLSVNLNAQIIADFGEIVLGNGVMIGPNVLIRASNHVSEDTGADIWGQGHTGGIIEIGDDVWIAGNVVILPGVKIGNHVIVAAGAVVTRTIPDYAVVGGIPARIIRDRREGRT